MFDNFPLWPARASSIAGNVDLLYIFLVLLSLFTCAAIFITLVVFVTKFRRRHGREAEQIEGSIILEIAWSVIPLGIFIVIFVWGAVIFFQAHTPPKDAAEIYVVGKQWMWKLQHVEGPREINQLHVPANRDIKLIMTSQDVIHDFFIPAFRVKQDVLPGRYTMIWFRATQPGTYHLFCSQYCGTQHSGMIGQVVVMEPAEYQAWMTTGGSFGSLAASGASLFAQLGCPTCHRSDLQGRAPNLVGIYGNPVTLEDGRTVTADENYIRESIVDPTAKVVSGFKPIMPVFQGLLDEEQLNSLVAYVKSLNQPQSGSAGESGTISAATKPQESKE
jgi:cytochrome c oxidase subunit II